MKYNLTSPENTKRVKCTYKSENLQELRQQPSATLVLKKPISYFENYINNDLLQIAVECTNSYAVSKSFHG